MLKKWRFLLESDFKISSRCCDVMKKQPAHKYEKETGRKPIIATMASESMNRENAWFKNGCNGYKAKNQQSTPMAFWTEQDVLSYIKRYNVPYCPVYGEIRAKRTPDANTLETTGCDRTGCMFCMFGCHLEKAPNRFQRMKVSHPKQYAYCMNELGLKEVLKYINVPYE